MKKRHLIEGLYASMMTVARTFFAPRSSDGQSARTKSGSDAAQ